MKKSLFMALILVIGATFTAASAAQKGDKKKKAVAEEEVVVVEPIVSAADSLSYAIGMAASRGLLPYLRNTCDFDTTFLADFVQGFRAALERNGDPKYVAYNAGVQIATQVQKQIFPREQMFFEGEDDALAMGTFSRGFLDGAVGDTTIFVAEGAARYAEDVKGAITAARNEAYLAENTAFLEENKMKDGVVTLPSGLQYKVLAEGNGALAADTTNVTVRYEGKLIDGTVFDSSYNRKPDTARFKPNKLIKGWQEALLLMPEGSKWEIYIPQDLAYGEQGARGIKPYSTLIFTVEVVEVEE